jgi:hypothetical protein
MLTRVESWRCQKRWAYSQADVPLPTGTLKARAGVDHSGYDSLLTRETSCFLGLTESRQFVSLCERIPARVADKVSPTPLSTGSSSRPVHNLPAFCGRRVAFASHADLPLGGPISITLSKFDRPAARWPSFRTPPQPTREPQVLPFGLARGLTAIRSVELAGLDQDRRGDWRRTV